MSDNTKSIACLTCNVRIIMPASVYDRMLKSGDTFHCINGHPQYFTRRQTAEQQLRERVDTLKRESERYYDNWITANVLNEKYERRIIAYRGHATRRRNARRRCKT